MATLCCQQPLENTVWQLGWGVQGVSEREEGKGAMYGPYTPRLNSAFMTRSVAVETLYAEFIDGYAGVRIGIR